MNKPCKSYAKYKAVYPPRCNCSPCWDKWFMKHPGEVAGVMTVLEKFPDRANNIITSIRGEKYTKELRRFLKEHPVYANSISRSENLVTPA